MPKDSTTMTVRLSAQIKERLEHLSVTTARSKSWLTVDAIETYLELQEWQVREIEAGICEANAGEFATDDEVQAVKNKWKNRAN